jgi:hypothetical protein
MKKFPAWLRSLRLWKGIVFVLALAVLLTEAFPGLHQNKRVAPERTAAARAGQALVSQVLAAEIYPEFTCPCCGQPLNKEDPCCGAMEEMIDFIDQQAASGLSQEEVMLATAKRFGLERLTHQEKQEEIKAELLAQAPADAPKIVLRPDAQDFGQVSQSRGEVSADFKLTNEGKSDLVIDKLSSSCGCTSAAIVYQGEEGPRFTMEGHGKDNPTDWRISIAPGDEAILRVYYDPNVHKDLRGPVTRTVSVFSNDPVEFEKKVKITLNQVP